MGYREKRFREHPYEKMFSKACGTHVHHDTPQRKGGSHETFNTRTLLEDFHNSFHSCENGKKCNTIAKVKAGVARFMIENNEHC